MISTLIPIVLVLSSVVIGEPSNGSKVNVKRSVKSYALPNGEVDLE